VSGNRTFGYQVGQQTIDQLSKVSQPNISLSVLVNMVLTSYNTVFHDRASPPSMHPAHIEFVTGRGGAGFHTPGPALTTGRGGYFGGDPRPAPVWGESPLIPWTGPVSPHLF